MKKKLLASMLTVMLLTGQMTAYAATATGRASTPTSIAPSKPTAPSAPSKPSMSTSPPSANAPSTSSRTGSFSTPSGSTGSSTPSSSSPPSDAAGSGSSSGTKTSSQPSGSFSGGANGVQSPSGSTGRTGASSAPAASQSGGSDFSVGASNKTNVPSVPSSASSTPAKDGKTNSADSQRVSSNVSGAADSSKNETAVNPTTQKAYNSGTSAYQSTRTGGSLWPAVGAFAAGTFLGSMLHPWGGDYSDAAGGSVHQSFSFFALLLDLIVIGMIVCVGLYIFRRVRAR